jgi:hypothetical protein
MGEGESKGNGEGERCHCQRDPNAPARPSIGDHGRFDRTGRSGGRTPARRHQRLELLQQIVRGLPAVGRSLLQTPHDHRFECGGAGWPEGTKRLGSLGHMRRQRLLRAPAHEWRPPRYEFVPQHPQRIDVRPVVDVGICGRLLRGHVGRRTQGDTCGCELLPASRLTQRLGDAEVGHQHMAAGEQHVVGLDVPVYDAALVGVGQRVADLDQNLDCIVDRQLALPCEPSAEGLSFHVGHGVIKEPAGFARIVHRQDVRVLEPGGGLDLAEESLGSQCRRKLGAKDLDRHLAAMPQILR